MLTTNLNVKFGLFIGSIGTVNDIIYGNGNGPKDSLPTVCMVEFPKYTGPTFLSCKLKLVPIVPVQRGLECICLNCHRQQIPLSLVGDDNTDVKAWPLVNERAVDLLSSTQVPISLNQNTRSTLYCLSKAKSAGGLIILPYFDWDPDILLNED